MKKRITLITITILVVAMMATAFAGCGGIDQGAYDGSATIKFVFDKAYDDISVSCPSAKIARVDATTYTCSLDSVEPVEIYVTAADREIKSYVYVTKELKKGEIVENVTLGAVKYFVDISIVLPKEYTALPKVIGRDDIIVEDKGDHAYTLVSDTRIRNDIALDLGDEYLDLVINLGSIEYTYGSYGKVANALTPLNASENNCVVTAPNMHVILMSATTGQQYQIQEYSTNGTILPIDTYYYYYGYNNENNIFKLDRSTLEANRYYEFKGQSRNKITVNMSDNYYLNTALNAEIYTDYEYHNNGHRNQIILSNRPLMENTIILINDNNGEGDRVYYYIITKEDIAKGEIDITDDKLIHMTHHSEYEGVNIPTERTVRFHYYDVEGKPINASLFNMRVNEYVDGYYEDVITEVPADTVVTIKPNVNTCFEKNETCDYNLTAGIEWSPERNNIVRVMLEASTDEVVDINIEFEKSYKRTLKFRDVDTNKILTKRDVYPDTEEIGDYGIDINVTNYSQIRPNRYSHSELNNYKIVDKRFMRAYGDDQYMLFDKDVYTDDEIIIDVKRVYKVKININNRDYLNHYTGVDALNFKNEALNSNISISKNETEENPSWIAITNDMKGKTYTFAVEEYEALSWGFARVWIEITVPTDVNDDSIINVTICEEEDEWHIGNRY